MKALAVVWLVGFVYFLLAKAALLVALFFAFGLGLVVGGAVVVIGIETVKREEELQR